MIAYRSVIESFHHMVDVFPQVLRMAPVPSMTVMHYIEI